MKNTMAVDTTHQAELDRFRKGTLQYTRLSLALLFFYLLWGDLVLQIMERVVQYVMPLQLKGLGASNITIGALVSTLPSVFDFLVNPIVSFRSDNFRSVWGRRRPFIFVATPLVMLMLILLAFAPDIGEMLYHFPALQFLAASRNAMIVLVIAGLLILFQVFRFCMSPIYYYLLVDVIPDAFMSRFLALFRIVGSFATYIFNAFIYQSATEHTKTIYVGTALFYGLSFLVMCWTVKEGSYPPAAHAKKMGLLASVRVYFRECYSHPHYLIFNVRNALSTVSGVVSIYAIFVFRDSLGLPMGLIGKTLAWTSIISAMLLYPMGALCDRFHPVRVLFIAMIIQAPISLITYFFQNSQTSFIILQLILQPCMALMQAVEMPMYASILPRERYGQFGSANQIVVALTVIVGSICAGRFMDITTENGCLIDQYRNLYLWMFIFQFAAIVFMFLLYRSWKRHGGSGNYIPPMPCTAGN